MSSEDISGDTPPQMKILNMVIPILMHFCSFVSNLECCKPHNAACCPTKCDIINDVKLFPAVYRMIYMYFHKFLTLSNRTFKASPLEYACEIVPVLEI